MNTAGGLTQRSDGFLVLGATGEIGGEVAQMLAESGYRVAAVARNKVKLEQLASDALGKGLRIVPYAIEGEFASASLRAEVRRAVAEMSVCDGLAFCIGRNRPMPFKTLPESVWADVLEANLGLAFVALGAFLSALRTIEDRPVRIVVLASTASHQGFPNSAAYCAAKHGLLGLVKAVATELDPKRVTLCALCPGLLQASSMLERVREQACATGEPEGSILARLESRASTETRRTVREVAGLMVSLLTGERGFVSGESITL